MKWAKWFWFGILALILVVSFTGGMWVHRARAQEVPATPPLAGDTQRQAVVEWRIRGFVLTKDRHPLGFVNHTGARFLSSKECLAKLTKPDAELAKVLKSVEDALKAKEAIPHWTCAPNLLPATDRGV